MSVRPSYPRIRVQAGDACTGSGLNHPPACIASEASDARTSVQAKEEGKASVFFINNHDLVQHFDINYINYIPAIWIYKR